MAYALIGGFVGLAFAAVEYWMFGAIISRAVGRGEQGRGLRILDLARKTQLILFPVAGFVVGWVLAGSFGAQ